MTKFSSLPLLSMLSELFVASSLKHYSFTTNTMDANVGHHQRRRLTIFLSFLTLASNLVSVFVLHFLPDDPFHLASQISIYSYLAGSISLLGFIGAYRVRPQRSGLDCRPNMVTDNLVQLEKLCACYSFRKPPAVGRPTLHGTANFDYDRIVWNA